MSKTIVCFGDSNTHGYKSEDVTRFNEHERWTCLLQEFLGSDYLIREEGLSGRTTSFEDPLFEGLCGTALIAPILQTHEPVDLLIIMLGTNDTKIRFSATPANIATGMTRLIGKAKSQSQAFRNGCPKILVITPPPIDPRYYETSIGQEMGPGCAEKSVGIEPLFKETAKAEGCEYLNAREIPGVVMAHYDWMHLSLDAHRAFAKALAEIIPTIV